MTAVLVLPFQAPPLRSNARLHWAVKAKLVASIRSDAYWTARGSGLSAFLSPVNVTFVWTVTDKRRRDAGASSGTLKAALDGIVDAGLLEDDSSRWVRSETCRIDLGDQPSCHIEIQEA